MFHMSLNALTYSGVSFIASLKRKDRQRTLVLLNCVDSSRLTVHCMLCAEQKTKIAPGNF